MKRGTAGIRPGSLYCSVGSFFFGKEMLGQLEEYEWMEQSNEDAARLMRLLT
jgi:hypothetical protein